MGCNCKWCDRIRALSEDKLKKFLTIITIALFAFGIGSAFYILFDYLNDSATRPKLIGKEEALSIAVESGRWNKSLLDGKTIDTKLLHIKNDGFAFSVDEKTLKDRTLVLNRFNDLREDQYVWLVQITLVGGSNREWWYLIDASNGILLNPKQNTTTLEPVDPQVSVKEGTLIRQASGDVTIVFPVGISKEESKQTPFPAELVVTQGDTVTWRNDDTQVHTVTSGFLQQPEFVGQVFDSGLIASGESFSHTFSDKSITSYHYFCAIHPWMTGEVSVQHPESEYSGLTEEQIIDIKHAQLGCTKTDNQTACDEMIQEKISYYKELNQSP